MLGPLSHSFLGILTLFGRYPVRMILLTWLMLAVCITARDAVTGKNRRDFTDYSLAAARITYNGGDPYQREEGRGTYKYFPLNATLLWPFIHLPVPLSQGIWTATNIVLLGLCLWAHRAVWTRQMRVPWWVWAVAIAVALRFFVKNLRLGQWNTSVYCLSFLGLTLIYRGRAWLGGLLVALAAGLKYLPSFFLIFLALRRRWLACAAMVLGYVFWVLFLPTVVHGPQRHWELLEKYWARAAKSYRGMVGPEYTSSHSLRSTLMRMTSEVKPRLPDPDVYDVTIVQLPKETARRLSEVIAWVILASTVTVTGIASRRSQQFEVGSSCAGHDRLAEATRGLRELLLVGLWYVTFLMISPETRTAHFLTLFTPAFALGVALAYWRGADVWRWLMIALLGAAVVMLLAVSEILEEAQYHLVASGLGFYAWSQVALWGATVIALLSHSAALAPDTDSEKQNSRATP